MLMKNQTDQIMPICRYTKGEKKFLFFLFKPRLVYALAKISFTFIDFTALAFWHWFGIKRKVYRCETWTKHCRAHHSECNHHLNEQHKFFHFFVCLFVFIQRSIKYVMMLKRIITNRVHALIYCLSHNAPVHTGDTIPKWQRLKGKNRSFSTGSSCIPFFNRIHSFLLCVWCVIIESANDHKLYGKRSANGNSHRR